MERNDMVGSGPRVAASIRLRHRQKGSTIEALQHRRYVGAILLADISGYTSFLNSVQEAHRRDAFAEGEVPVAYAMMSSFLEGVASVIEPPFSVVKFEGDAAFAVVSDDDSPREDAMVDLVSECYADFARRRDEAGRVWTCTCDACSRKTNLDLKFIVHHGEYFVQTVGSQIEVVGPDVNVAHRLTKNGAVDLIGSLGYGLFTDAAVSALDLALPDAAALTEAVDDGEEVGAKVIPLPA